MDHIDLRSSPDANAERGWVDLDAASNNLAWQFRLGSEHSQCFRTMRQCTPECKNLQVAMRATHELHHQSLESLGQSLGLRVLKAATPRRDRGDGPYAVAFGRHQLLTFDDYLPALIWLKTEKERQAIDLVARPTSEAAARTCIALRL